MHTYLPPTWIPHLKKSPKNSSTIVKTKKYHVPEIFSHVFFEDTDIERMFFIKLHVYVDFYSELDVDMKNPIPAPHITATRPFQPAGNPNSMAAWLREVFLKNLIPFPLDSCTLIEGRHPGRLVSGEDELLNVISGFFIAGKSELEVGSLEVKKSVVLSEQEFGSWVTWYVGQDRVDPYYKDVCEERAIGKFRFLSNREDKSLGNSEVYDEEFDYVGEFFEFLDSI